MCYLIFYMNTSGFVRNVDASESSRKEITL